MDEILNKIYHIYHKNPKISTDTRKIEPGSIFFALKGENFNGNTFVKEAFEKGASFCVIDEAAYQINEQCFLVQDVLQMLQQLARKHRQVLSIPLIVVGGSNGKTTTKELIYRVLSKKYKTFATQGNLNNHIGVPLSLLSIGADTQIAVIEIGANHQGETKELCQIAEPDFGLLTNVGLDHLEGFGGWEGVKKANKELYDYLSENNKKIFINTNEEVLLEISKHIPNTQKITYPNQNDYLHITLSPSDFFVSYISENQEIVNTKLLGRYNFSNIATALCVGKFFAISPKDANEAVAEYEPQNNRSQVLRKENNILILDAYNANPSSMQEAIANIALMKQSPKVLILGQMNELGAFSETEHQKLGNFIAQQNFDLVVLFGEEMQQALKALPQAYFFVDKFSLHNWLIDKKIQNSLILIKGSRGAKMETVVDFL
ncbi:MAG: UDP-N-acetylmuramoyl-tripeptide--D-alanyl-D-alanine ligase [Thermonemataceae bacterium]|nr:UDP-N-acetylmuramoyl-tripeptide--D-alanyl-D-alanine ligase [Thermonemataceae bacterium]